MFKLIWMKPPAKADAFVAAPEERRTAPRTPLFREALIEIEDYYRIRAVITNLSENGAGVAFSTRVDLPSRVQLSEPTLKLSRWSRVVWQRDGRAGLEFLPYGKGRS